MPLFDLQRAFNDLHIELTGTIALCAGNLLQDAVSPAQICAAVGGDEIPHLGDAPEKTEAKSPPRPRPQSPTEAA